MIDEKLKHIAIIMDGNGRWATERGLKRTAGHKEGLSTLEKVAIHAFKSGLKVLSVFAFSVDNFKRSSEEVGYLMDLFVKSFGKTEAKLAKENIKIVFSGSREGALPEDARKTIEIIENRTKDKTGGILNVCLNYCGQDEIVRAAKRYHEDVVSGNVNPDEISRENFFKYLDNDLPPIDILIRTGGDNRVSNFMLYQLYYAEMFFKETYWPDFTEEMLDEIIDNFYGRERRFGRINEEKSAS